MVLIADKIRESFGELETPSRLHALGMSQLLVGKYDDAARSLLAASREQPDNARYLNDVAVVQLERARVGLRADDLPRALAAADRATHLDPSLHEAWFNRALAMTELSLTDQAKQAWTEYLARDNSSPWAGEARTRLAALSQPTPASNWPGIEQRLHGNIDATLAGEAVRAQTTEARQFIETILLPAWAAAVERGGPASKELERVRLMADAMQRVAGDALHHDVVTAIDRAEARGSNALSALAVAHRTYAAAAALFVDDRFQEAKPGLTAARQEFADAGSPYALRAALDLAAVVSYEGRPQEAAQIREALLGASRQGHYSNITARLTWQQGLSDVAQGRLSDAQSNYEATLAVFEEMGDAEGSAAAHSLLAALNDYVGDEEEAWRHRLLAFDGLSVSLSPRLKYVILGSAVPSVRATSPQTALTLQNAALETAISLGRPVPILEGLAQRASILLSIGRDNDAKRDLIDARAELARVPDPSFRKTVELRILAVESDLLRTTDPAAAALAAARGIEILEQRGDRMRLAQLNLRLARANIAGGRLDAADAALASGLKAFDDERASQSDEGRISTLDESWQLFETSVQLALKKKDYPRAFVMAERARARSLAEARRMPANRSLSDVEKTVENGEAIIALNQFDDELVLWLIRHDGTTVVTRSITKRDADRLVARQRDEIRYESTTPEAGAALYNEILKPLATRLRGVTRLVVVPDATYQDAAFAGLWDSSRRRFLVEDVTLSLAPSASAFIRSVEGPRLASGPNAPLVLGGPDAASDADARAVASLYQSAQLLTGTAATSAKFFADAPGRAIVHVSAQTAPNQAYPLLARLTLADEPGQRYSGIVLGRDIAARSFAKTSLVVLAESRATNVEENAGTLGVARAFLAAGVPNVLGTLPGIDDTARGNLILGFHRQLASGSSASQALNQLQRNVLQSNGRRLGAWCALVMYGSDR